MQSTTTAPPQLLDLSGLSDAALRGLLGEVIDTLGQRDPGGAALLETAHAITQRLRATNIGSDDDGDTPVVDDAGLSESLRGLHGLGCALHAEKLRRLHALS